MSEQTTNHRLILKLKELGVLEEFSMTFRGFDGKQTPVEKFLELMVQQEGDRLLELILEEEPVHIPSEELDNMDLEVPDQNLLRLSITELQHVLTTVVNKKKPAHKKWVNEMYAKHKDAFTTFLKSALEEEYSKE
jgi:hypothetical protein